MPEFCHEKHRCRFNGANKAVVEAIPSIYRSLSFKTTIICLDYFSSSLSGNSILNFEEATGYSGVMTDFGVASLLEGFNDATTKVYL